MKWMLLYLFFIFDVSAKIQVVATTSDLAWAIEKLGGNRVSVESLLHGSEDPHYVDAMPHWILKVSRADVFCKIGLELEVGWIPKILARSGNAKVQPGGKGHCDASKKVTALDVPIGKIDRSMGDVHPGGNPHYHLGPNAYLQAIEGIFTVLVDVDPEGIKTYANNLASIKKDILQLKNKINRILRPVKKKKFMSYHKEFSYFLNDFGLTSIGELEETPGVPPSAGRIARVSLQAKKNNVAMVIVSKNNPRKIIDRFSEISNVPVASVSTSIQKNGNPRNYQELLLQLAYALARKSK